MNAQRRPSQIVLLSAPRTCSHLLERIFSRQTGVSYADGDHLIPPLMIQHEWASSPSCEEGMPREQKWRFEKATKELSKHWRDGLEQASANGKIFWLLTHPYLGLEPDIGAAYLRSKKSYKSIPRDITLYDKDVLFAPDTLAIFTIRNPYRWIPSVYRVTSANARAWADPTQPTGSGEYYLAGSLLWSRQLCDYYKLQGYQTLIVNADDFLNSAEFAMHLAEVVKLDPSECIFQWEKMSEETQQQLPGMLRYVQETLINSEGVIRSKKATGLDIENEKLKLAEGFGQDAALVKEMIDLAMPHYEYMYAQRLTLP